MEPKLTNNSINSFNNNEFFTEKQWQIRYPKCEVKAINKALERNEPKKLIPTYLHYLIANDSFSETRPINNAITKESLLAKDAKQSNLTSLHIMVMKANEVGVQVLLNHAKKILSEKEFQAYINSQDTQGWTALHFAALTSDKIFELLISFGADQEVKNESKGTPDNLRLLAGKKSCNFSIKHLTLKTKNVEKSFAELNQDELKNAGIEEYRDFPLYKNQETWDQLWQEDIEKVIYNRLNIQCILKLQELRQSPPELSIEDCLEIKGKKLVANYKILKGKAIGTYSGLCRTFQKFTNFVDLFRPPFSVTTHRLNNLDAKEIGNGIRYANKGRPNAFSINSTIEGSEITLMIAGQDIEKGQDINWDYGPITEEVNFGADLLFGRDQLHKDFKNGIDPLLENYQSVKATKKKMENDSFYKFDELVNFSMAESLLFYPLNTPAALIDLHFSGLVSINEWIFFIKRIIKDTYSSKSSEFPDLAKKIFDKLLLYSVMYSTMKRIQTFSDFMKKRQENTKAISEWFCNSRGKITVMQMLKAMELIHNANNDDINKLLQEVENIVKNYDWLEDPNAALSHERRKEDFVEFLKVFIPENYDGKKCVMASINGAKESDPNFLKSETYKLMKYTYSKL